MAKVIDIERKRGDNKSITFKLWADQAQGIPFFADVADAIGYTFKFTVDPAKNPINDDNNVLSLTGTAIEDSRVRFSMTKSQIATIGPGVYYYDFEVTDPLDVTWTPAEGKYKITQDITK